MAPPQFFPEPSPDDTAAAEPEFALPEIELASSTEPQFAPTPFVAPVPLHTTSTATYVLIGSAGVLIVLMLTVILLLVARPLPSSTPPPPVVLAPLPLPPRAVTEPANGSSWFSEAPAAESQPATMPVVVATPVPAPQPAPAIPPAVPHAGLFVIKPTSQPQPAREVTDAQISNALQRGTDFLLNQFTKTRLKDADRYDPQLFGGLNALAIYALLHAGLAQSDARVSSQSPMVRELLDRLKEYPMTGSRATYSRSLRISALSIFNRSEDRATIESDARWLLNASLKGAFDYDAPGSGENRATHRWDNSNSQYGALGLWAAADAGIKAPNIFWSDVEKHWNSAQVPSGGWGYDPGAQNATLSMTAAGTTMLFVARDQQASDTSGTRPYVPLTKPQERALEWLEEGDNSVNVDGGHRGYSLYGLERAGLASGYKYFGKHDWYLELARSTIDAQQPDGSWAGGDGVIAETSFNLLFLARGRNPVFIAKLKCDGPWENRPRDLESFTRFASRQLERPLNWEIADVDHNWWEWSDSPLLMITSDQPLNLTDPQIDRLREFARGGGLILLNTERGSKQFQNWADALVNKLFPELPRGPVPADSELYSLVFPLPADQFPLLGVSNGARYLVLQSTADLSRYWVQTPNASQRNYIEMGANIAVYANGRRDLRNRAVSNYVPDLSTPPLATMPLARLKYAGAWDPEPQAWVRGGKLLQIATGIALDARPTLLADLSYETSALAHLSGTAPFDLTDADANAVQNYISRGGVLLIDAFGAAPAFSDFVRQKLLPRCGIDQPLLPANVDDPLIDGSLPHTIDIRQPKLRPAVYNSPLAPILISHYKAGAVILLRLDLTSGLLGSSTVGIKGYQPSWSQDFVTNLVLWTISRLPRR